jgi:hypothetical protein
MVARALPQRSARIIKTFPTFGVDVRRRTLNRSQLVVIPESDNVVSQIGPKQSRWVLGRYVMTIDEKPSGRPGVTSHRTMTRVLINIESVGASFTHSGRLEKALVLV